MKTETVTTMDYPEWDELVKANFPLIMGGDYALQAQEELGREVWASDCNKGDLIKFHTFRDFIQMVSGDPDKCMYRANCLHAYFVEVGLIPEGRLLVDCR